MILSEKIRGNGRTVTRSLSGRLLLGYRSHLKHTMIDNMFAIIAIIELCPMTGKLSNHLAWWNIYNNSFYYFKLMDAIIKVLLSLILQSAFLVYPSSAWVRRSGS